MNNRTIAGMLWLIAPALCYSQGQQIFSCSMGDLTRRIEIVSEPGVSVPCEVHYYKDNENPDPRQVLWRAQNEAGYCEARTQEFLASLTSLGWNCDQAQSMPAVLPEPDVAEENDEIEIDDTADLAPAPTDPH